MAISYSEKVRAARASDEFIEKAYAMSSDWSFLKFILDKTPVFGLIDHNGLRDPVLIRKWVDGEYRASVRGVGYIEEQWDEFVKQAEKYNLSYAMSHDLTFAQSLPDCRKGNRGEKI